MRLIIYVKRKSAKNPSSGINPPTHKAALVKDRQSHKASLMFIIIASATVNKITETLFTAAEDPVLAQRNICPEQDINLGACDAPAS
jgi:hypothetical protein